MQCVELVRILPRKQNCFRETAVLEYARFPKAISCHYSFRLERLPKRDISPPRQYARVVSIAQCSLD
jgi:hypothetical protein